VDSGSRQKKRVKQGNRASASIQSEREKALELAAIVGLALRQTFLKRHSHLFGAHESPTDIPVFRTGIERNQPIAVLAIRLEPVADFLGPLSEYLRALRTFDFYFFVDHETPEKCQHSAFFGLKACFGVC
jgi:hypothetical protein